MVPELLRLASRAAFIQRVRLLSAAADASVYLDVAPDVVIGRAVRVFVQPRTRNTLVIGAGTTIGPDVYVLLKGGTVEIGPWCDVRKGVVLNVAGQLVLEGENVVSWGTVVHCAGSVRLARKAMLGDYACLVDSSHYYTEPDTVIHRNVRTSSVSVGYNSWVAAKATLAAGADVGAHCIVAAHAFVSGQVPDGHLATGAPATVRPLDLPWQVGDG